MSEAENFEIHFSREKGVWRLTDVMFSAEAAIGKAREIAGEPGIAGVRVVSSRFDPVLDAFAERTIYKRSHDDNVSGASGGVDGEIGCRTGRDLHRRTARRAIQRVLAAELERRHITVLELLHDHGQARSIADTGTVMQAAVQRHAIESAQPGSPAVATRINRLYAVIEDAMASSRTVARRPDRPVLADGGLDGIVRDWAGTDSGTDMVYSVLAWYLRSATNWGEKLSLLTRALPAAPSAAELRFVDPIAAEILEARGGIAAFIGSEARGGAAVVAMLSLAEHGRADSLTPAAAGLLGAAGGIAALPLLRAALSGRARRIVDMHGPLGDGTVADEFRWLHAARQVIGNAAPDGPNSLLPAAVERRAERFTSAEQLGVLLAEIREPIARMEQLFVLEPMITGAAARKQLGKYLHAVLADRSAAVGFEDRADANSGEQLRRFARWQRKLLKSSLPPAQRQLLAALVDDQAVRVLRERQLLGAISRRVPEPWRQVLALMDLVQSEHFTRGQATALAQEFIAQRLNNQAVVDALQKAMRDDAQVAAKARAMREFLARDANGAPPGATRVQTLVVAK